MAVWVSERPRIMVPVAVSVMPIVGAVTVCPKLLIVPTPPPPLVMFVW
jgi:hypothetical protein